MSERVAFEVAPIVAALQHDGYVIAEGVVDGDELGRMRAELVAILDATPTGRNDFEGFDTKRIYRLFGKTRVFDEWAIHPVLLGVLDAVIGPCLLSAPTGIQIGPGEPAQVLHRDGGGANQTAVPRLGVILEYVAGWLRPQENHVIGVPPDLVATLPARLQELLGYDIYPPFVGSVDGRHPRRFLPTADRA